MENREHVLTIDDIQNRNAKFVIGGKGTAYLKNKKYKMMAVIMPLSLSIVSLIISLINL